MKNVQKAVGKRTGVSVRKHPGRYLRRVYEHLGRIDILEGALSGVPFVDVTELANLAEQQLASGHVKNAAALLRAAEHISFASLAPKSTSPVISQELKRAIAAEFGYLDRRTESRWADAEDPGQRKVIADLYTRTLDASRKAYRQGAFQPALELARAAEALSRVTENLPSTLPGDRKLTGRLAS